MSRACPLPGSLSSLLLGPSHPYSLFLNCNEEFLDLGGAREREADNFIHPKNELSLRTRNSALCSDAPVCLRNEELRLPSAHFAFCPVPRVSFGLVSSHVLKLSMPSKVPAPSQLPGHRQRFSLQMLALMILLFLTRILTFSKNSFMKHRLPSLAIMAGVSVRDFQRKRIYTYV